MAYHEMPIIWYTVYQIMFIDYTIDIGIYWNILWSIQYHLAVIWRCPIEPARCRRAERVKERPAEVAGPTG